MKKIIPILIISTILLSGLNASASSIIQKEDDVDQQCINHLGDGSVYIGFVIGKSDIYKKIAQSFVPTKEILTKVDVYMNKYLHASEHCTLSIRSDLDGEDLVSINKSADEFDITFEWVTFDIDDLNVTPGETYYICLSSEYSVNNVYYCSVIDTEHQQDFYPQGRFYTSINGGDYTQLSEYIDLNFKTYGYNDTKPVVNFENPKEGFIHFFGNPLLESILFKKFTIAFGGFNLNPILINATDDITPEEDLIVKVYKDDELLGNATYDSEEGFHIFEWFEAGTFICKLKVTVEDEKGNIAKASINNLFYIKLISLFQ